MKNISTEGAQALIYLLERMLQKKGVALHPGYYQHFAKLQNSLESDGYWQVHAQRLAQMERVPLDALLSWHELGGGLPLQALLEKDLAGESYLAETLLSRWFVRVLKEVYGRSALSFAVTGPYGMVHGESRVVRAQMWTIWLTHPAHRICSVGLVPVSSAFVDADHCYLRAA